MNRPTPSSAISNWRVASSAMRRPRGGRRVCGLVVVVHRIEHRTGTLRRRAESRYTSLRPCDRCWRIGNSLRSAVTSSGGSTVVVISAAPVTFAVQALCELRPPLSTNSALQHDLYAIGLQLLEDPAVMGHEQDA